MNITKKFIMSPWPLFLLTIIALFITGIQFVVAASAKTRPAIAIDVACTIESFKSSGKYLEAVIHCGDKTTEVIDSEFVAAYMNNPTRKFACTLYDISGPDCKFTSD
jgi:hypothetical protein